MAAAASPAPPQARRLDRPDGAQLFCRSWAPAAAPRAELLVVHGYLEHGGRYDRLAAACTAQGVRVTIPDLRGHGLSSGRRGDTGSTDACLRDLAAVLELADPALPRWVLGHSFGGLLALALAGDGAAQVAALVLINPFLRLAPGRRTLAARLAPWAGRLFPRLHVAAKITSEELSADPEAVARHRSDPLISERATLGWARDTDALQREVAGAAEPLPCRSMWLLGGADSVADAAFSRHLRQRLAGGDGDRLLDLPAGRHELLHDIGGQQATGALVDWLTRP